MRKQQCFACLILIVALFQTDLVFSQDSTSLYDQFYNFPDKVFFGLGKKSENVERKIRNASERAIARIAKRERKLLRKIKKHAATEKYPALASLYADSSLGKFLDSGAKQFKGRNIYSSHMDSMVTTMKLLATLKQPGRGLLSNRYSNVLSKYNALQTELNSSYKISVLLEQRQERWKSLLNNSRLKREYKNIQRQVYYYRERVDEYKRLWENPRKMESKLLTVVASSKTFQNFFARHSQLASIFRLPDPQNISPIVDGGLQTRQMIVQEMQQRLGGNVQQQIQNGIGDAQSHMNGIKDRITAFGNKNGGDKPSFKPNTQRGKSFLKRVELEANVQSARSTFLLPSMTDVGLGVGIKLSDRYTAGTGLSYKLGWGSGIRNIRLTNEGVGFRTYVEMKFKGEFWLAGGAELNHFSRFRDLRSTLRNYSSWQRSALLGISKRYSGPKKIGGKVQVLYNFLYRLETPESQPIIFRFNYSLLK